MGHREYRFDNNNNSQNSPQTSITADKGRVLKKKATKKGIGSTSARLPAESTLGWYMGVVNLICGGSNGYRFGICVHI